MPTQELVNLDDWLRRNDLSRSSFYNLPPDSRPPIIRMGRRILVPVRAAGDWIDELVKSGRPLHTRRGSPGEP
jgi:hypothetical protein